MKKIYLLLFLIANSSFSQNFDKNWNQVIELENEDKIKSALEIVDNIYKKAHRKNDEVQIIKCFFYKSKYLQRIDENAQGKILDDLCFNIKHVSKPSKSILHIVYAKCLEEYSSKYNYSLQKRTKIDSSATKNFLTCNSMDFYNEIEKAYAKSLENQDELKTISLLKYEQIFDFLTLEKFRSMTLLDYVLKENINRNNYSSYNFFQKNKDEFYGSSEGFLKIKTDTIQSESLRNILKQYQKLEENTTFEKQFERLKFVNEKLLYSNIDYQKALNRLQKYRIDDYLLQKILLEKVCFFQNLASKESTINYNTKAIEVLDSILNIENRSNAFVKASRIKNQILAKSISFQLQKYIYTNENTRAFINYKNIDSIKISFYKINMKTIRDLNNYELKRDSIIEIIKSKNKSEKTKKYQLINKKDYFSYSSELLLPQLETGNYLVCFESENTNNTKKAEAYETLTVSNFTILTNIKDYKEIYHVVDRKTGKPLENVTLKNDYFEIKTNNKGMAIFTREKDIDYNNYRSEKYYNKITTLQKDGDTLQIHSYNLDDFEDYSLEKTDLNLIGKVQLYLDRAIYRPGQTVYYKGIAAQKKGIKTKTVADLLLKIIITDSGDNNLKEFEVTTNEFGSFSGEFLLPKNCLTGDFQIRVEEPDDSEKCKLYNKKTKKHPYWDNADFDDSQINFKVEEYKRPKFEITFDKIKEDILVKQRTTVKGIAKAFSGSNITDAKVSYTIVRNTYTYYNDFYSNDEQDEISIGEVKTDADGKFSIEFITEPNEEIDKKNLPVFGYTIKVNVTDINGETQSSQTTVKSGYHALVLTTQIPNSIDPKEENKISFNSANLNGEFSATKGEVKLYFKKEYETKFKPRIFQKPELDGFSEEDFNTLFPFELNAKQTVKDQLGTLVYSKNVNTEIDKEILLNFIKNYKSGYYTLVFSAKDKYENYIEDKTNFEIFDRSKPTSNKLFTIEKLNVSPKKDGFISLKIHSSITELHLFSVGNYREYVFDEQNIKLQNGQAIIKIPLKKEFENGVKIGFEGVFENQYFSDSFDVNFANEVEKIDIETETFRNKIEPGSNEFWSFKLKQKGAFLESEALASMYDSSLDQFTKTDWQNLAFSNDNYTDIKYRNKYCFVKINATIKNLNVFKGIPKTKNEDTKLIWFGFDFNSNYNYYQSEEYKRQLTKKLKKPKGSHWISGYIFNNQYQLPGVNIMVKRTNRRATSDFDGYYEIEAAPEEEVVFSFIGMNEKIITVGDSLQYDVTMEENESGLQEVVVTAYGTQKKSNMTASVSMIKSKEINPDEDYLDVYSVLAGKVSGIEIKQGVSGASPTIRIRGSSTINSNNEVLIIIDGVISNTANMQNITPSDILSVTILKDSQATALYGEQGKNGVMLITTKKGIQELTKIKARKNLSETAFFLPHLKTDSSGRLNFNFTSPEALTEWKLRLLVHNKNAISGYLQKSIVTQKDLMVTPNFPRFLREKDSITITAKVANISRVAKTGIAMLQLSDAITIESIDKKMLNTNSIKNFNIPAYGNTTVSWKIYVPEGLQGVQYKILAKSGNFSDGEENILPVLTNNILVTESIPIWVRENSKKEYHFDNLKNNQSSTLQNHQFTLEYTSNPTWLAIQSLPYLMEYEHGCTEQTFARFYSNAIASEIINSNPKIASVFETWRNNNKSGNKLEENEELKSIILAETPWLNDVRSEDEKKNKLALLFDLEKMKNSQEEIFKVLKQMQRSSGGFTWYGGENESEYITRHIMAGFGHLKKLSQNSNLKEKISEVSKNGIPFIDKKFIESSKYIDKYYKSTGNMHWENHYADYHYLYTRSFYLDSHPLSDDLKKIIKKHLEIAKENWIKSSLYEKALISIIMHRFDETETAKTIIQSLKETASNNEDCGMYWIENKSGYYWYQAPIETQALLIEAFAEVTNDTKSIDAMKVWLIKNKQNKNWTTTKATTEAVYALLMKGTNWLSVKDNIIFKIGNEKLVTKKMSESQKEAEIGYIKLTWKTNEIKKEMATITVENKSKIPGFGGFYWQYFEDLDKIKNDNKGFLSVSKELFIKKNTSKGTILEKITSNNSLKIGNIVTVRLVISSKEDIEFVHLKDMRASCFEPVNVLSEYKYQGSLSFYQSNKDTATHFFFDQFKKGTYVLEYDIRVNNIGNFSNGITTIQSMYAPEFSSHTKGIRVTTKE